MRIHAFVTVAIATFALGASAAARLDEAQKADAALNAAYQTAMELLSGDRKKALRNAQRAWITFRDSACTFESFLKGSEHPNWIEQQTKPALDVQCIRRLTLERIAHLRRYTDYLRRDFLPSATQSNGQVTTCRIGNLPSDFTVQAVGVYEGGIDTDVQLDSSGHETKSVEVIVNRPGENVVVVLMAYDPVLWQLKRTPTSNVVGVIVGGYHGQAVLGIARSVPLQISTNTGRNDCGRYFYAYKAGRNLLRANDAVKNMTGRDIDHLWSNYTGYRVHIGPPPSNAQLVSSSDYSVEDYTNLPRFPSGQKGIERLIKLGLLRRATSADLDTWVKKASARYKRFNQDLKVRRPFGPQGSYVVLGKMTFPTGLYGGHAVAFLIPAGIPFPDGKPGHSSVYFLEDGTCRGPFCQASHE